MATEDGTVHPGSYCSPAGATGKTKADTPMVCSAGEKGGRTRWRRNGPSPARSPRRRARQSAAAGGTLPVVNAGIDPTRPAPAAEQPPDQPKMPQPVDGHHTDQPPLDNDWGGFAQPGHHYFHGDGPIGLASSMLGADRQIDMGDGKSLGNTLGDLATAGTIGDIHPSQMPARLTAVRDQLPEGRARRTLDMLIADVSAPDTPAPQLPYDTPDEVRALAADLHSVPMCRREPDKELDGLVAAAQAYSQHRMHRRLARDLADLRNHRHESYSDVGKGYIDQAITNVVRKLNPHTV